ncbi:glycosyltransferase [Litchfieldella rifensis]|uniref:Glycosyltransferase n=1 Tax=Litchfieldella rifensis TaxID=762643 RepID=A0ABV7LTJ6_9GAMM
MNAYCVGIVRYSILSYTQGGGWETFSQDLDEYQRKLFDPGRLALHQRLFSEVTLASLDSQSVELSKDWFTLLVLTSTELPKENRAFLEQLNASRDWMEIKALPPENPGMGAAVMECLKARVDTPVYATLRLDDDDALANDYFARLSPYLAPRFRNFAVSFASGYAGLHNGEGYTRFKQYYQPNVALGLASIHDKQQLTKKTGEAKQIFQLGNHTKIDRRVPVILDSRQPAYIRTVHEHSDSAKRTVRKVSKLDDVPFETVKVKFPTCL